VERAHTVRIASAQARAAHDGEVRPQFAGHRRCHRVAMFEGSSVTTQDPQSTGRLRSYMPHTAGGLCGDQMFKRRAARISGGARDHERRISLVAVCCSTPRSGSGSWPGAREQPRVLDGDGGPVGRRSQQSDMTLGWKARPHAEVNSIIRGRAPRREPRNR